MHWAQKVASAPGRPTTCPVWYDYQSGSKWPTAAAAAAAACYNQLMTDRQTDRQHATINSWQTDRQTACYNQLMTDRRCTDWQDVNLSGRWTAAEAEWVHWHQEMTLCQSTVVPSELPWYVQRSTASCPSVETLAAPSQPESGSTQTDSNHQLALVTKFNTPTRQLLYLRNASIFLHQISLICCALTHCFVLYLLDTCQLDRNANFKNELHNWTKSWFYY